MDLFLKKINPRVINNCYFLQDPCIREIKEFISNDTFDVPNLHYIDNETQNDPCQPDAIPQISEFNPHQFTSSSSKYYFI